MKQPEEPDTTQPVEFMVKLESVRQAYRVLDDLEESVDDLSLGLAALHDDVSGACILLRAFQRRQGFDGTDPKESERAP